jgi:hypothetical protein
MTQGKRVVALGGVGAPDEHAESVGTSARFPRVRALSSRYPLNHDRVGRSSRNRRPPASGLTAGNPGRDSLFATPPPQLD